jgi:hypothetical protein
VHNGEEYFYRSVREKNLQFSQENPKLNKLDHNGDFILTDRELEIITLIALEFGGRDKRSTLYQYEYSRNASKNVIRKIRRKKIRFG